MDALSGPGEEPPFPNLLDMLRAKDGQDQSALELLARAPAQARAAVLGTNVSRREDRHCSLLQGLIIEGHADLLKGLLTGPNGDQPIEREALFGLMSQQHSASGMTALHLILETGHPEMAQMPRLLREMISSDFQFAVLWGGIRDGQGRSVEDLFNEVMPQPAPPADQGAQA